MADKQLSWIGLGNMGRGMCKNLVEKGSLSKPLILYNRTTQRATDLSEKLGKDKTKVAESIKDAVTSADVIFFCLGDDKAVKDSVDTALKEDVSGKLFVDCSTIHPDTTNELSSTITAKGAHFVASPVFGAPAMADAGQLVAVLAGPKADIEKVRPYCKGVTARAEIDLTDQKPGNATTLKVIGNSMILQMVESLSEAYTVAETTGLGAGYIHQFVENLFPGPFVAYGKRMLEGDYYQRDSPLFHVDLALKDAGHVLKLASDSGAKMKSIEVAQEHLKTVKKEKGNKGDLPGIYGAVRLESGLPFENQK